jgi:hypothetical protein
MAPIISPDHFVQCIHSTFRLTSLITELLSGAKSCRLSHHPVSAVPDLLSDDGDKLEQQN